MEQSQERPVVVFNVKGEGLVQCDQCGKTRSMALPSLDEQKKILHRGGVRVRCSCGHSFHVEVDLRQAQQTDLKIAGKLLQLPPGGRYYDITITALSVNQVSFSMPISTTIAPGAIFEILFKLADKHNSVIYRHIQISQRNNRQFDAVFYDDQAPEKAEHLYSMSKQSIPLRDELRHSDMLTPALG